MPQITSFPSRLSASDRVMWRIEARPAAQVGGRRGRIARRGTRLEGGTSHVRTRHRAAAPAPPTDRLRRARWYTVRADDPSFSLDYHIRRVAAPSPGDLRGSLDLVAPIASCALDPARPLWECTVVDGLEGGRGAFGGKFHHTMTDGVGGMELAGDVFDCARHGGPRGRRAHRSGSGGHAVQRARSSGSSSRACRGFE